MADVTDATFETDVLERSKTVPVVVDLWAPWCGPCQSLGPILEKVVGETQGLVELAKVDVDQNPSVSQAFQVQSIPAVYAMYDGKVVNGFMGAQGEPEVVSFVQELIDMAAASGGVATDTEADGDSADASDDESVDPAPVASAAAAAPVAGAAAAAGAMAAPQAPAGNEAPPNVIVPDAVISEPPGQAPPAQPAVSAEEADAIEAELASLLDSVKGDDEARERYLALLDQLCAADPRTNDYRRKLATALF